MKANVMLAIVGLVSLAQPTEVAAWSTYVTKIPNGKGVQGVAALGHTNPTGTGPLNAFGTGFKQVGKTWTKELCLIDSDGDGQTNGQELGDPCCEWSSGATPRFTDGISHPGDATSMAKADRWANITCATTLLGAVGQAFVFITVRQLQGINAHVIVHYFMLFGVLGSLAYIALVQRAFVVPSTFSLWVAVIGSGIFTFVGQVLLTKGFQLEKAGIASVMRYLDVVCVFIWE